MAMAHPHAHVVEEKKDKDDLNIKKRKGRNRHRHPQVIIACARVLHKCMTKQSLRPCRMVNISKLLSGRKRETPPELQGVHSYHPRGQGLQICWRACCSLPEYFLVVLLSSLGGQSIPQSHTITLPFFSFRMPVLQFNRSLGYSVLSP